MHIFYVLAEKKTHFCVRRGKMMVRKFLQNVKWYGTVFNQRRISINMHRRQKSGQKKKIINVYYAHCEAVHGETLK